MKKTRRFVALLLAAVLALALFTACGDHREQTERVGCKNKPSRADKVPERAYKTIFYALAAAHTRVCSGAGVSFSLPLSGDTPQRRSCHP